MFFSRVKKRCKSFLQLFFHIRLVAIFLIFNLMTKVYQSLRPTVLSSQVLIASPSVWLSIPFFVAFKNIFSSKSFFIMVKTLFNETAISLRKIGIAVIAVVAMLVVNVTTAHAQESAKGGPGNTENPYAAQAAKLGVTAYNLGALNVDNGKTALTQQSAALKPLMGDGNLPALSKFKYAYYTKILSDMGYSIAPEISLINRLGEVNQAAGTNLTPSQMVAVYDQTVVLFQ